MSRTLATLRIPGHPVVLKNSKQVIRVNGRTIVKSSKIVEAYQHKAIAALCDQWGDRDPIRGPISVAIVSCGAWKSTNVNMPDASNLYQMPEDLLEAAGVIVTDNQIEHHDGSRRVCLCDNCPKRPLYKAGLKKGTPKPDCGAMRQCDQEVVLVTIRRVMAETGVYEHGGDYLIEEEPTADVPLFSTQETSQCS